MDYASAECAKPGMDPEWWFSPKGQAHTKAVGICLNCPIMEACHAEAVQRREPYGVFGAAGPAERREIGAYPLHGASADWVVVLRAVQSGVVPPEATRKERGLIFRGLRGRGYTEAELAEMGLAGRSVAQLAASRVRAAAA